MEGQKAPRTRTAPGNLPPRIAFQIACSVEAAILTSDALTCCTSYDSPEILASVLIPSFRSYLERDWFFHVSKTLADFVENHYQEHRGSRSGTRSGTWRRITRQDVSDAIEEAFMLMQEPDSINLAIEQAVAEGFDAEYLASEIIIRETHRHTGLLHKEIAKIRSSLPDTDPADLMGFAWKGLRVALRQYDPSLGYAFSTFACPKINGAIRDGVRSEHHLPKRLTTFVRKISAAEEHLTQALARTPSFSDIAEYLDDASAGLELTTRLASPASLDEMSAVPGGREKELTCLVDQTNPEDLAVESSRRASIRKALADLDDTPRELILMLFFEEVTLTCAAERLGMDVRSARTMRDKAYEELRLDLLPWSVVS